MLLFAAEPATLSYRTIGQGACSTRVDPEVCVTTGGDAHSHVLWLIAVAVLVFALGAAAGRSRPASIALAACGVVVLVIALGFDMPKLDETRDLETLYTDVKAHTGGAFRLEIVGGVLAIAAGLAGLTRFGVPSRPRRRRGGGADEPAMTAEERAAERAKKREAASSS